MKFAIEMAERQRGEDNVTPLQDQESGQEVERDGKTFKKTLVAAWNQHFWEDQETGDLYDDDF